MRRPATALSAFTLMLAACSDPATPPETSQETVGENYRFDDREPRGGTTIFWNSVARNLVIKYNSNTFQALRAYAVLSVAEYQAVTAARRSRAGNVRVRVREAVNGASAVALTYLYPAEANALEALVDSLQAAAGGQGSHADQGEALGRDAGQRVVERAKTDNFFTPWSGTVPSGPGLWFSTSVPPAPPVGVLFGQARPYFLSSGSQFRPSPPPVFGSQEYLAALAEVRQISDTRTPQQDSIAKFWALPVGTYAPPGYWNAEAARLAAQYHLDEHDAASVFALLNMVGFDAIIASHDAKYTWWFIRPTQADPGIRLAVGLPNFPSYPSNHAALSAAMAKILAAYFPREAKRLHGLAEQAAMSRLYAGIHYRFDNETGLRLGRAVAGWALKQSECGRGRRDESSPCAGPVGQWR